LAIFSIHAHGTTTNDVRDAKFLRGGFNLMVFWLGPVWLLRHRFYVVLAIWLAIFLALVVAAATILSPVASLAILVLIEALLGFEADALIGAKLDREKDQLIGIVAAPTREDAEITFYRRHGVALEERS
jgi:hypothetical protein